MFFGAGLAAGLALSRVPHYIERYANHSLPVEYAGPRYVIGGRVVTREVFERYEPNGDPEL